MYTHTQKDNLKIKFISTFGPDTISPCFIFSLTSCLPASLANMIRFESFVQLTALPSSGVCTMLCVGDICAEINKLSEFYHIEGKEGKQIVTILFLHVYQDI